MANEVQGRRRHKEVLSIMAILPLHYPATEKALLDSFIYLLLLFQAYMKIYQGEELPHPKSMLQVSSVPTVDFSVAVKRLDLLGSIHADI